MATENTVDVGPFGQTLRHRLGLVDALAVVVVPVVLGAVYRLPAETRRGLAFEYTDPSLVTAYTATFVHLGFEHVLANTLTYVAAVSVALLLATLTGTRRRFYAAFGLFLLAFPVALSYLNLAFVRPAIGFGFSGVVMAFVGYLPLAVAESVDEHFEIGPRRDLAPLLFFGSLALIGLLSLRSVATDRVGVTLATLGATLTATLAALVYARAVARQTTGLREQVRAGLNASGYAELVVVGVVLVVAVQFVAFPARPAAGEATLNSYTHLLGYALGFILVYSAVEVAVPLRTRLAPVAAVAPWASPDRLPAAGAPVDAPSRSPSQQPSPGDAASPSSSPGERSPDGA